MQLGKRLSDKRKELGLTQAELAEQMHVTRQTISRWEAGAVYPDIEKVSDLAKILNVSCDYLLLEDHAGNTDQSEKVPSSITRLLGNLIGKRVKLNFYDEEEDYDLLLKECLVKGFEGNWVQVEASSAKENIQKLIPVSSILSVEILSDL